MCTCSTDDLDLELRLARFEELMDRRPFLLSRFALFQLVYRSLSFLLLFWLVCSFARTHTMSMSGSRELSCSKTNLERSVAALII